LNASTIVLFSRFSLFASKLHLLPSLAALSPSPDAGLTHILQFSYLPRWILHHVHHFNVILPSDEASDSKDLERAGEHLHPAAIVPDGLTATLRPFQEHTTCFRKPRSGCVFDSGQTLCSTHSKSPTSETPGTSKRGLAILYSHPERGRLCATPLVASTSIHIYMAIRLT